MRIIEALKSLKDLDQKAFDLRAKIKEHSAYASFETPRYVDQKTQVDRWLQAHRDILLLIEKTQFNIQKTNIATMVSITIGDKKVTKSIAEWILRRRKLIKLEQESWSLLTDKGIKEGQGAGPSGVLEIKLIRAYDPKEKDEKLEQLRAEPFLIDSALEIVNATTDLIEGYIN